ncbi:MAG TPA: hypothetical protein VN442_23180 [Bryobacteraceae bacterium]|nr:hypothetical protein [Bryobacteraceae bacterium]
MRSSVWFRLAILPVAGMAGLLAQEMPLDPQSSFNINLPSDAPVALRSANLGESRATARGSAMVVDLHMALSLQNTSNKRIAGITLLVTAQEFVPGGRGSVATPSLSVAPGATFPVRIDLRLLRPAQMTGGPLVNVTLDGVLFQDLSFYGPNRLDSRRSLTAWEIEAQRDRQHFKSVLAATGAPGLRQEVLTSLAMQAERPRLDVAVSRGGRSVTSAGQERVERFAFLQFPDSPVAPVEGWAQIAGNEARAPRIEVRNRSTQPVKYVEIGWVVKDRSGKQFMAGSVPASDPDLYLPPGRTGRVLQDTALRFSRNGGQPVYVQAMTGFVSQVEFANGTVWVPNRRDLTNAQLLQVLAPSPEEQRLTELYRKKGLDALVAELNRF